MPLGASRLLLSSDNASHASVEEFFTADDVFYLLLFLAVIWLAGKVAAAARLPALVGEVLAGALCGPPLGDWVPVPQAVALLGQVGLVLLVVESGLEVQTAMLRTVGMRGLAIAFAGSVCGPLLIGLGLSVAVGLTPTEGLAVGSALSPTSMGVSVILFKQWRILVRPSSRTSLAVARWTRERQSCHLDSRTVGSYAHAIHSRRTRPRRRRSSQLPCWTTSSASCSSRSCTR